MTSLQVLNMAYCRKISDEGVVKLVYKLPSLIQLDIQNTNIS